MLIKKYFSGAFIFTIASLLIAFCLGGVKFVVMALMLGVIEVSLSFDNAIVNASVLKTMSEIWQKRFITWGMLIAVVGMRFILPILIVMCAGHVGMVEAINTALFNHARYEQILNSSHVEIMTFGGTFLMLVGLNFFLDDEKDNHWIGTIENLLAKAGGIKSIQIQITLFILCIASYCLPMSHISGYWIAGVVAIIIYMLIDQLGSILDTDNANTLVAKSGLAGFLYLEVLDSSFSFDGVISSFIITNDIVLIALGLGIGAIFIRSFTLLFVDKGVLSEYKYLEAGAFYSILALAGCSFISIYIDVPSIVTGVISITLIALSFVSSVNYNRKFKLCKGN